MTRNLRRLIRNLRNAEDVREDLRSLVTILGAQPTGSVAWKCGNLAAATLADFNELFPPAEKLSERVQHEPIRPARDAR